MHWWISPEDKTWLDRLENAFATGERSGKECFSYVRIAGGRSYLLPRAARGTAVAGCSLYSPQTGLGRLFKAALMAGLKTETLPSLLPVVELDLGRLRRTFVAAYGLQDVHFAVSMGTPGPHRTPVAQVMTSEGHALGYVKFGFLGPGKELVRNEANAIRRVRDLGVPRLVIPGIMAFEDAPDWSVLLTQPLPRSRGCQEPHPFAGAASRVLLEVLLNVLETSREDRPFLSSPFSRHVTHRLASLQNCIPESQRRVLHAAAETLADVLANATVPCSWRLGDVTPWNSTVCDGRVFLVDLENAAPGWLAGWDLIHYARARGWRYTAHHTGDGELVAWFLRRIGAPGSYLDVLYLAYLLDVFTDWAAAWQAYSRPPSPRAAKALRGLAGEMEWMLDYIRRKRP